MQRKIHGPTGPERAGGSREHALRLNAGIFAGYLQGERGIGRRESLSNTRKGPVFQILTKMAKDNRTIGGKE